jgi:hypothetical protein
VCPGLDDEIGFLLSPPNQWHWIFIFFSEELTDASRTVTGRDDLVSLDCHCCKFQSVIITVLMVLVLQTVLLMTLMTQQHNYVCFFVGYTTSCWLQVVPHTLTPLVQLVCMHAIHTLLGLVSVHIMVQQNILEPNHCDLYCTIWECLDLGRVLLHEFYGQFTSG